MCRLLLAAILASAATLPSPAVAAPASQACRQLETQRDRVDRQLRRPHGASEANRLHARRRELNARLAAQCR